MELAQSRVEDVSVVAVSGRIDHANADAFKAGLEPFVKACRAGGDRLLLDLAGLQYVSSAGLRVLMLAAREVRQNQGAIALCELQPVVKEIFEISRFNVVFRIFPDRRAALDALAAAAG